MEPEKYYTLCNQVSIDGTRLCFALCRRRENSCLNFRLQLSTEGSSSLNIQSFLLVQILHDIRMMISMKNETFSFSFISLKICMGGWIFATATPMEAQQALAKLHRRKRWETLSIFCRIQRSQVQDSKSIFLLCNSSLVLK